MEINIKWALLVAALSLPLHAQPIPDTQRFAVLRSDHLTVPVELGSSGKEYCSIVGSGNTATMRCQTWNGTSKIYFQYNTALLLDEKGTAYVIACRAHLLAPWCKPFESGTVLHGNFENGELAIAEGPKVRHYQVLTTAYVGLESPAQSSSPDETSSPRVSVQPAIVTNTTRTKAPEGQSGSIGTDVCASSAKACVMFTSEPVGADIYIDGKFAGTTPSMLSLAAGMHDIRIEAKDFKSWTRKFEGTAGSKVTIQAKLEPIN